MTSTDTNKEIVRRYMEECWVKPDLELVDELVTPDVSMYNHPFFPEGIRGIERIKRIITNVRDLVPDLWIRVDDIVCEADKVALCWTAGGTQRGQWKDEIPATGKQVSWTGMDIYRIMEGKIVELKEVEDGLSLLHQIRALGTWKSNE